MQNNTELLCLILEFQSRSLIVQGLLQAEAAKEYEADWLKNAKVVTRDTTGRFASKGSSIKQSVQDTTAILKQGFDLTGDTIQSLIKDPEFRKRAGLAAGLPMAKLISNLATQARLNPKLTEKLDEWIANATKEFADQYGDDKNPMAQAIRNNKLAQPPKDASFNEKMEFRVAQYTAYQEALKNPEDFSKRDEIIGKAAAASIPIGVSLAIALGFEVAIPLFLAQSVNWATVLSSVALGEAADFAVQKGMDKLEINNPALRIGASMVAGILAGGLVTGVNNKIAFAKQTKKSLETLGEPKLYLYAQNLDNESQDHLRYKGNDNLDIEQRRKVVFDASEIRSRGKEKKIRDINNLNIGITDKEFTLEIMPNELDKAGRGSAIVAHGELPKGFNPEQKEQWIDEVVQEIEQFTTDINRTFKPETIEGLKDFFRGPERVANRASSNLGKPKFDISAQNADNINPDHYMSKGVVLPEDPDILEGIPYEKQFDRLKQMAIASRASKIEGKKIAISHELGIRSDNKSFLAEITGIELDEGGRFMPILVQGDLPKGLTPKEMDQWVDEAINEVKQFGSIFGRTFQPETLDDFKTWLTNKDKLKPKIENHTRELVRQEAKWVEQLKTNELARRFLLGKPKLDISAQDLDNLNPDIYTSKGIDLPHGSTENNSKRISITRNIDNFLNKNKFESLGDEIKIAKDKEKFVAKMTPNEKDGYGRLAPILVHGELPKGLNPEQMGQWVEEAIAEIEQFTASIDRTFKPEVIERLRNFFFDHTKIKRINNP